MAGGDRQALVVSARQAWLQVTAAGALGMTALDGLLLQQKKAFFTGGFLAGVHTAGAVEALGFLALSVVCDAAIVGVFAVAGFAIVARLHLTPAARALAAALAGVVPLVLADVAAYRLAAYLGDAFDLALLFDLAGRRPAEFGAIATGHLLAPALLVGSATGAAGGLIWVVNRCSRRVPSPVRLGGSLLLPAAALLLAGVATWAAASLGSETFEDGLGRKPSGKLLGWIVERTTDFDRDSFGVVGSLRDPAPFDRAIFPYAVDVPGNGIDENGVGGDLPSGAAAYAEPDITPASWPQKPNVVLVVLESFRADAVGRSENGIPVTPVLDALARQGVASSRAVSHNGYTAQSRFHLFSGSLAGLRETTILDDFKSQGYEVAYFSGQDDSFGGAAYSVGMERADVAYDARQDKARRYTRFATSGSLAVPFDVVQARLARFLDERDPSRPLFLYLNFHETHYPYTRQGLQPLISRELLPEAGIGPSRADALRRMYFNTAANVDAAVGATLDLLADRLGSPPAVVVTADHGESLFDGGFLGHGYALDDVQTRIPLILRGLPIEIEEPFGQTDLREAINRGLAGLPGAPRLVRNPQKRVFQYLGRIERPRQIGFWSGESRTLYDFRTRQVQLGGGAWQHPGELTGAGRTEFLELVQAWERMIYARTRAGKPRRAERAVVEP